MQSAGTTSLESPLIVLTVSFPVSSLPLDVKVLPQYSSCCRRKTGFFSCVLHSWGSWTLSSSGDVTTGSFSPLLCSLGGRGGAGKVPFTFSTGPILVGFCFCFCFSSPLQCWILSLRNLDFYKVSLICEYLPKLALSMISLTGAEEGWGQSISTC